MSGYNWIHSKFANRTLFNGFGLKSWNFLLKVEEGCQLKSANDIAGAVHHMLGIIEESSNLPSGDQLFKLPQIPL